jgi:xylulokinase
MTGEVATDLTMVSAAGLSDSSGELVPELREATGDRIPPALQPVAVAGSLDRAPAAELRLPVGVPVCIGAGDRACEMLGTAAASRPMVSWGTTANVSLLVDVYPDPPPEGVIVTTPASEGWLLEGGLSAAGSLITWLSALTGLDPAALMHRAASSPAGAGGAVALPWFGGARAPWWRAGARGAFVGLSFDHDAGDLARAAIESVAWEVRRCLVALGAIPATGAVAAASLALTGSDGRTDPWPQILAAVTGLPGVRRRSGQAASAGAALLAAIALGSPYDLDRLDPVVDTVEPDPPAVARYAELRASADAAADAVVALGDGPGAP